MTDPLSSIWHTGTHSVAAQFADRGYHRDSDTDRWAMPPAVAAHAITALTRPGDVVLDPDCGTGTVIVEALTAGRHAIGLTTQPHHWRLARANVTATKATGAPSDGMVLVLNRRPSTLRAAATGGLTGRVALLLTTLRTAPALDVADRLRAVLTECRPLLRGGAHVAISISPTRDATTHALLDLPARVLATGTALGLAPVARCLALTAHPRGQRVRTHASLAERRAAARIATLTGRPIALSAHHTVLVFRVDPDAADAALAAPTPLPLTRRKSAVARRLAVPPAGLAA
jgi:hypothetical protein